MREYGTGPETSEYEYRVQFRRAGSEEWRTVITNRGGGRPFFSLAAAKGVLTREKKKANRYRLNRNTTLAAQGKPLEDEAEYRIQRRPVSAAWQDVEL